MTIERTDSIRLGIDRLIKLQRRNPTAGTWRYVYGEDGSLGWLTATLHLDWELGFGSVEIRFHIHHYSRDTGERSQTIALTSRPCRYGGRRWYFLCPSLRTRCSKLYLPNGCTAFYGRKALRLAYQSTRETVLDRAHRRLRKLYARLGGDYSGIDSIWPGRPKGMRRRTFHAIRARIGDGEDALNVAFLRSAERFFKHDPELAKRLR